MLTSLNLNNFKAWRQVDLKFAPITGFFGTNSSGKSSLIQFLLMLKQTKNATDRRIVLDFGDASGFVNLGTYNDIIHNQDSANHMSWSLEWSLSESLKIHRLGATKNDILLSGNSLVAGCRIGTAPRGALSHQYLFYKLDNVEFCLRKKADNTSNKFELKSDSSLFPFNRKTRGRAWNPPAPIKTHIFPDETRHYFQNAEFLGEFEIAYEKFMDSLYYLGPLREFPKRDYHWSGSFPTDVGQRGENAIAAILAATRDKEKRSLGHWKRKKSFQEMVAYWLCKLGLIQEFRIEKISEGSNIYRALVRMPGSKAEVALTDVGFGVSQVLPVIVLPYYVPEGSTILMEQPEIHLHPAVQSGLADLLLNVAKTRNLQIIVESHSEHLLRRFQRRVAEDESSSTNLRMYFISSDKGVAKADDLNLNEWGELENWPKDFFGDEMGEIAAIMKSGIRRRMEKS